MIIKTIRQLSAKSKEDKPKQPKHPVRFWRKMGRFMVYLLGWVGIGVFYYAVFSFFFDTPTEMGMKRSAADLRKEYDKLEERYGLIEGVLENVSEREKYLYKSMFDSYPMGASGDEVRLDHYMSMTNQELADGFMSKADSLMSAMSAMTGNLKDLQQKIEERGLEMNDIPSIQPVIGKEMTSIATSIGMRLHPFYKTMVQHNGIDYAVPEGSRVFATADGTVKTVKTTRTSTGISIVISHPDGYETYYNNLSKAIARVGTKVRRGDIIALSGNTGLSLAPHLHYEVRLNGKPVDPVNYFFYELNPAGYAKMQSLAAVGMQSLD